MLPIQFDDHPWNNDAYSIGIINSICEAEAVRNILEIGTCLGLSSLAFATQGLKVTTCDIEDMRHEAIRTHPHIKFVLGTIDDVRKLNKKFDAAFIDGDHSYAGVSKDFKGCEAMGIRLLFLHDVIGVADVARFVNEQRRNPHYELLTVYTQKTLNHEVIRNGLAIL